MKSLQEWKVEKVKENFLIGSYTKRTSQGIYAGTLDIEKNEISPLTLAQAETSPTYLTTSKKGVLYTVGSDALGGGIISYQPNDKGDYSLINKAIRPGNAPCYVAVDEKRQLVYSANYHLGEIVSYKILENGGLKIADIVTHSGSGPHPNQEKAHLHYTDLAPDERLIACDLGTDEIYTYDVAENGKLTQAAVFKTAAGTGPRHLGFHPKENIAYVIGELASTITVLTYFPDGHFEKVESHSTLPKDFSGENSGGAIRITKDGHFLYASNRGDNSLAIFTVKNNGKKLELLTIIKTKGAFPRDFAFDPQEKFLICTHQNSDYLSLFKKNEDGTLTFLNADIFAPEAVCIHF